MQKLLGYLDKPNGQMIVLLIGAALLIFRTDGCSNRLPTTSPVSKINAVTFFYEKDEAVPSNISDIRKALSDINDRTDVNITASEHEDDTTTGKGNIPVQYKISLPAARVFGMPCLIVMGGEVILNKIKNPTLQQIKEVVP